MATSATVRVRGLLHVNVEVTDLARALAFYRVLGVEEVPRQGAPGRPGAWLRLPDGGELHLSIGPARLPSRAHFAVLVEDLEAARATFEMIGAPLERERDLPGQTRFFTRDPHGNRIEVVQHTPLTSPRIYARDRRRNG